MFGTYSYIFYFIILSVCFKFSIPRQNFEFHIHRNHIEIRLPDEIKFRARKMIKRMHFMSPCKMINLFQDVVKNVFDIHTYIRTYIHTYID